MREEYVITISKVSFVRQKRVFSKLDYGKVKYCVYIEGVTANGCRVSFFSTECKLHESGYGNYIYDKKTEFITEVSVDFSEPSFRINSSKCIRPAFHRGDTIKIIGSVKTFSLNHTRLTRVNLVK